MKRLKSGYALFFIYALMLSLASAYLSGQPKHVDVLPSMPTPTVANLAKYCEFQEIDQNGTVPIEIPIWDLSYKGINIPVKLKYQCSGVRVGQESSWVGLGWNLEALGFITRSIRDIPDDLVKDRNVTGGGTLDKYTYKGWLNDPSLYQDFPDYSDLSGTQAQKSAAFLCFNEYGVTQQRRDSEPDVFFLKIGNIEESFVFDHSGNVVFINPKQKLRVIKADNLTSGISEFCVTDSKGNKYYFGSQSYPDNYIENTKVSYELNTTYNGYVSQQSRYYCFESGGIENMEFRTTWFLRKIDLINDPSSIDFSYTATEEKFSVLLDKYYTLTEDQSQIDRPLVQGLWSGIHKIDHTANTKYLSGITYPSGSIAFILGSRNDIDGAKKLTSIFIRDNNNTVVKYCNFFYSDQVTGGTEPLFERTRMYLDSIKISGNVNYHFDYYSKNGLPQKKSDKQDFWGYYSAKPTNLIPKIYVYPDRSDYLMYSCFPVTGENNPVVLPGSDRTVDPEVIKYGSLKSIRFPTGGYEEFILESNDFYDDAWGEKDGGGLRISEIRYKDKNNNLLRSKKFYYQDDGLSSGVLINGLFFATPTAYNYGGINNYMEYDPNIQNSWDYFTLRRGNNYFPLISNDGALVSYTKVSIVESGNGRVEKEYNPPPNYKTNATLVDWATTYELHSSYFSGPQGELIERGFAYINLRNYGLYIKDSTVYVPIYEMVDGSFWYYHGILSYEFYFKYLGDYFLIDHLDPARPNLFPFRVLNEESDIVMGKVKKTGYNIFPFPPISDDYDFTRGKLIKESFFVESQILPVKEISYSYDTVGTGTNVFGVYYKSSLVYNAFLSPLPVQVDQSFILQYGENGARYKEYNARLFQLPKNWGKYRIIGNVFSNVSNKVITEYSENSTKARHIDHLWPE